MRITIAGGSGFLGRALSRALIAEGHGITLLTRGAGAAPSADGIERRSWNPDGRVGDWVAAIDGADAVVNLAGESIGAGLWTAARRRAIHDSRVLATRSIVSAMTRVARPPSILVSASGQNYYGDRGEEELTEESAPGSDFLARVCLDWESEALQAAPLARVVLLRTALVLDKNEGALPRMLLPFRLFGGGRLGNGRQFMSWVHLRDWVGIATVALSDARIVGPVNAGAPRPVRNAEFAAEIGRVMHRPSWFPAPSFALRAAMGEMAEALLLGSTRMRPARLLEMGYRFAFPDLQPALRDILD
jgi:uncharacterized protein (TIGR01777 family)